jgi:hypothetical protein
MFSPAAYQLALTMPGISPAKAISRILARPSRIAERATGTTGDCATVTLTRWVRIAGQLLQPRRAAARSSSLRLASLAIALSSACFFAYLASQFVALELALD